MIPLVDTHAHLYMEPLGAICETVYRRGIAGRFPETVGGLNEGEFTLDFVLVPGIDLRTSREAVEMARHYPAIRSAVGVHPNGCDGMMEEDWTAIGRLAEEPEVVAVGETGLDRYRDRTPFSLQIECFERHLVLARERDLPILIHCREAAGDLMPILRREAKRTKAPLVVIHAFSGDAVMARECVELGHFISFAGSLTYTNRKFAPLWEAARVVPAERLLLETDAPFLTPEPYRGKLEGNEPLMTVFIAKRLAELRGTTTSEIARQTTANARKLFLSKPIDSEIGTVS